MQRGFLTLLAVLVLAAVGATVSVALFLSAVNASQTASTFQEGEQAKGIANACAEVALQKLVTSSSYVGTGSATLGQGSCTYSVTATSGTLDTIQSTGTVGQSVRKVKITIAIPALTISTWQEVGDF